MQIINQIGHIQHWGLSPAHNLFKNFPIPLNQPHTLRVLLSGCSDIRHILKTLCDLTLLEHLTGVSPHPQLSIQFYQHEPNKQLLARIMLCLQIIHETHLSHEERVQLFLDLYGNAMIKERNARYVHNLRQHFLNFVHGEKLPNPTILPRLVSLKLLKFDEIDDLSEIVQSWSTKVIFNMAKYRDEKMRYLYKQRYDYRSNLVDWDYNMLLIGVAPVVHYYHYKEWRLTGLAYEQRFSSYCEPNRTLASYAEGKKKAERTSCLVRGYWGDIVISPYIALGIACDYPQADLLFKKANYKFIGHSVEIAEYNLNMWLMALQSAEEYRKVFRDYYRADEETKKTLDEKEQNKGKTKSIGGKQKRKVKNSEEDKDKPKLQQIPELAGEDQAATADHKVEIRKETNQEQQKRKEANQEQQKLKETNQQQQQLKDTNQEQEKVKEVNLKHNQENSNETKEKILKDTHQSHEQQTEGSSVTPTNQEQLDSDQQKQKGKVDLLNQKDIPQTAASEPLLAFKSHNVSIHLLGMKGQNLVKPKFASFFDIVVLGFTHSAYLTKNIQSLVKPGGHLLAEKATYLIPKKLQQRTQINKKLEALLGDTMELLTIQEKDFLECKRKQDK